jgi:hypothetical protein
MKNAVATPKQIRELMKVDGLTNDEVKSHLQVIYAHFLRLNSILVFLIKELIISLIYLLIWRTRKKFPYT